MTKLVDTYLNSDNTFDIIHNSIYISNVNMCLADYCKAREIVCCTRHKEGCGNCRGMIVAARVILSSGVAPLSKVFKTAFPSLTYHSPIAKKRLLQMPIVAFHLQSRNNQLYLMEKVEGLVYHQLVNFIDKIAQLPKKETEQLNGLLTLAQSDSEKECIRYGVFKSSGCTSTEARIQFGFENMGTRAAKVESCIDESNEISAVVQELAEIQYQAFRDMFATGCASEDDSNESNEYFAPEDILSNKDIDLVDDETLVSIL